MSIVRFYYHVLVKRGGGNFVPKNRNIGRCLEHTTHAFRVGEEGDDGVNSYIFYASFTPFVPTAESIFGSCCCCCRLLLPGKVQVQMMMKLSIHFLLVLCFCCDWHQLRWWEKLNFVIVKKNKFWWV